MRQFIYPYKPASESAKKLAAALGIKRIKKEGSKWRHRENKRVLNWGCSEENLPEHLTNPFINWINTPQAVSKAANKLLSFKAMAEAGVSVPAFTEDKEEAQEWLLDNRIVFARTKLNGNSGEGIVEVEGEEELPNAPLYVRYVPKKDEFRIHVVNGKVIAKQRKARVKEVADEDVNWRIRNLANGFIFARNEDFPVPNEVCVQAFKAVEALGLDFGAVDVGWNERDAKAYVYEVNTACGLEGSTLDDYVEAFSKEV